MAEHAIGMTAPEAALILTAIISLADDNPSEEEAIVLRKYYKAETAGTLEEKIEKSGLKYPEDIMDFEKEALDVLSGADAVFVKRTLSVCLKIAESDGTVDQTEFNLLNKYCDQFDLTIYELEQFSLKKLHEIDETHDYTDLDDLSDSEIPLNIDVITSYSIHYTKLYEPFPGDREPRDTHADACRAGAGQPAAARRPDAAAIGVSEQDRYRRRAPARGGQ